MPLPLIPVIAGAARAVAPLIAGTVARTAAGTAGRAVAGQAAKKAGQQAAQKTAFGVGRTASGAAGSGTTGSGKTLQATKPRKEWDWSNMASNFTSNDGDFV